MCTSTTTQSAKLPEQTPDEKRLNKLLLDGILPSMLSEAGYDLETIKTPGIRKPMPPNFMSNLTYPTPIERRQAEWDRQNPVQEEEEYSFRKKASGEVEALRSQYGKESQEYKSAYSSWQSSEFKKEGFKEELNKNFMEKTNKFLMGDFSVNESQKAQIQETLAPMRAAITQVFGGGDLDKSVSQLMDQSKQSGMSLGSMLNTAGNQIQSGGGTLDDALTKVISVNRELMKMGIQDMTGDMTKKVMGQAAAMGRDPTDPEYQKEMQQNVARDVQRGQLELAGQEAQGRMGIAQQRAQAVLGLGEQESNLRMQVGGMMAPQQLGAASSAMQYQNALKQQDLANLQATGGMFGGEEQKLLQQRMAQAETTQVTKEAPLSIFSGLLRGGAAAYGGWKGTK